MKKLLALLLCAVVMLPAGCRPKEPLDVIRERLSEDCSVRIASEYVNLGVNGFSQETAQEFGKDGTFHFTNDRHQWDHTQDFDSTDSRQYFYRYEDDSLICYLKENDKEIQRIVMSAEKEEGLWASRNILIGAEGLLPYYMENFVDQGEHSGTGLREFTFQIPVKQEIQRESLLSTFLQTAFELYGSEYDPETNLYVSCLLEVEKDTLHPVRLTYDFSEIKPYVLSEGALSGEDDLETNLMTLTYEFNYEIPKTIPVPDTFKDTVAK